MTNKYYLYKHIRLDKNIPFYIGIGTKKKSNLNCVIYARANDKVTRNKIWKDITKSLYIIEILEESNDYNIIKTKK